MLRRVILAAVVLGLVLVPLAGASASARTRARDVSSDLAVTAFNPAVNAQLAGAAPDELPVRWLGQQVQSEVRIENPASRPVVAWVQIVYPLDGFVVVDEMVTIDGGGVDVVELNWPADGLPVGIHDLEVIVEYSEDPDPSNNTAEGSILIAVPGDKFLWVSEFDAALSSDGGLLVVSADLDAVAMRGDEGRYRRSGRVAPSDIDLSGFVIEIHLGPGGSEDYQHTFQMRTDNAGQATTSVNLAVGCDDSLIIAGLDFLAIEDYVFLSGLSASPVVFVDECAPAPL